MIRYTAATWSSSPPYGLTNFPSGGGTLGIANQECCIYATYTPAPSGLPGIRGVGSVLGVQGGVPAIVVASPGELQDYS
jgi:hypothetical protein